jgi:hypothetical protein
MIRGILFMKSMNEEQFNAVLGLYSKKGYHIIKDPEVKGEIPPFLNSLNYYPDYIIRSEDTNYVVELSSSKKSDNDKKLKNIVEEVEKNTAWEFILVVVDTPSKIDKSLHDVKLKDDKPRRRIKRDEDKPTPVVKQKEYKPTPVVKQKEDKPAPVVKKEEDKPAPAAGKKEDKSTPVVGQKDKKPPPVPEPEDEQPVIGFEVEAEDSEDDFETEFEISVSDLDSEDIKLRSEVEPAKEELPAGFESITKGYQNLKLMLESKHFESYQEPVLLYGWALLESMIRKLIEKEQTGIDIGFLLNEAVSDGIIDNSEISGLKKVYLLRNKLVHGEFGIVIEKLQSEPLIKVVNKLYGKYFS